MHKLLLILVLGAVYCNADEPFSIGLGVLSPSYKQTVGKENVQVTFDQKENGQFAYSVGDPKTGTNTYLNFGPSAASQPANQGYAAPAAAQPNAYGAAQPNAYAAPAAAQPNAYGAAQPNAYGAAQPNAYAAPAAAPASYQPVNFANSPNYGAAPGYNAPAPASGYGGQGQAYNQYQSSGGYGNGLARQPENSAGILPAGFSYHATEGQAFLRQQGEQRKPEGANNVLPAGFSYHAMEGQSFLRQGDSPNFMVAEDKQSTGRGPAEQSFYQNFRGNSQQGGQGLVNGLVGYGAGGPSSGNLPIGGYAGPEYQGAHKEHGGHQ